MQENQQLISIKMHINTLNKNLMTENKNIMHLPVLHGDTDSEFTIIHKEDTTTQNFLSSIIKKKPWRWRFVRNVFSGRDDVSLTVVDKSADTPFRCLLLALFIKQLGDDFSFCYRRVLIYVTLLPMESHHGTSMTNERFGSTIQRNTFLQQCVKRIVGIDAKLKCKRFIINKRDSKLSTKDFSLNIRVGKGVSHGWQSEGEEYAYLMPYELLDRHEDDIPCFNVKSRSGHKEGVLISLELQSNFK